MISPGYDEATLNRFGERGRKAWRDLSDAGIGVGESGEDEFGLTHVVAEVLGLEPFQILVGSDADAAPFLMDEVR